MSKFKQNNNLTTKELCISSLLLAVAFIFSNIKIGMPYGGSITMFNLLLVAVVGYLFGAKVGLISALAYGFLQLIAGGYVIHPIQMLLDYPIAYMCLGLSGFFRTKKTGSLYIGFIVGNIGKYLCHVITGVVFFREAATLKAAIIYSLTYNAYVIWEVAISLILIPFLLPVFNKLKKTYINDSLKDVATTITNTSAKDNSNK